jgi:crotonobetainyl-CoA:carnitine CoA-transferase CaiB-like acyl-CoA transferase
MTLPLTGTKVVDLTRILSGPFCTMMLGDMGADVVKVESPCEGDPVRKLGAIANGVSWYFASYNRNKRSVTLDLRTPEGKEMLARMLAKADVLVENFRPGVLAEMGFDETRLQQINPRLIVASINGYGSTGPYADRPAFDFVIQAMSGFMSCNGTDDGPPLRAGPPLTDLMAGIYAAFGIVNALHAREKNGRGQRVEASMMDAIMSTFAYLAADHLATGALLPRSGNDHPITAPYGMFSASDGEIAVAPSTEAVLDRFLAAIGLNDLRADPRFATNNLRVRNRALLNQLVNERMKSDTQAAWLRRLNDAGVPCGLVQNLREALADPQTLHQQMVIEVEHPGHGPVKMLGFPVKLSVTPCEVRYPAPAHGGHTREVFEEWGIMLDDAVAESETPAKENAFESE